MATSVQYTQSFPAPPDRVWAMLSNPEYIHLKGMRSGSLEVNPEVEEQGESTVIISRRRLPAKLPGFMKKFVGEEIIINETQTWGAAAADGTRAGTFVIDFGGQPMAIHGSLTIQAAGTGTEVTTDGSLKSTVPFVGGKAEAVAKDWTERYLRKEEEVAKEWLAEH
jgi:carbon monoxide dehydrogenase subunit G